jgi:hypothetical protein
MPWAYAQIAEGEEQFRKGTYNAFTFTIENIDKGTVEDAWMKFTKDYKSRGRKEKDQAEIFADNAEIRGMSDNRVDVYAIVNQVEGNVDMKVWFDLGGAYLNTAEHPGQIIFANNMLSRFMKEMELISNERELAKQKGIKNDMNKEIKKLKDEMNKIEDRIGKLKEKIKEKEVELETIQILRDQKKAKFDEQKQLIGSIKAKIEELSK